MLVANYESWTKILIFVALRPISRHAAMGSAFATSLRDKPDASLTRLPPKGCERVITPKAGKRGKAARF
jgi:hypothetical protein